MSNQRTTFAKRQREQTRKDRAKAKQERLAARRASSGDEKGPPIAWDEAVNTSVTGPSDSAPAPATNGAATTLPADDAAND